MNRFAPLLAFSVITLFTYQHASARASLQSYSVTSEAAATVVFTGVGPQSPRAKVWATPGQSRSISACWVLSPPVWY